MNGKELLVIPLVLRLIVIVIIHRVVHHTHPESQVTQARIKSRYWWLEIDDDVDYFIKYCKLCQLIKHTVSQQEMKPFVPNALGQVVEYDFWGHVFGIFSFLGFYDMFTDILKMRMAKAADAVVVVHSVMTSCVPLELIADIGGGCKNSLIELFSSICGIKGLYASPRRTSSNW